MNVLFLFAAEVNTPLHMVCAVHSMPQLHRIRSCFLRHVINPISTKADGIFGLRTMAGC